MKRVTRLAFVSVTFTGLLVAQRPDRVISRKVNGSRLTVRTSARTAGAIDSITWRGKEFIDAWDHGRELQSASSFDGYGECLNPTEAGSAEDARGPVSSSRLLQAKTGRHKLETRIEMAYWLAPGTIYPRPCGSHQDFRRAFNQTIRSQDTLRKRVKLGVRGLPNVLEYEMTFTTTDDHQAATFEALTGYMPPDFSDFLALDPAKGTIALLPEGMGEQPRPVILATPDHQYAMGIYSPGLPQPKHPGNGYGRFRFVANPVKPGNTVKWNAVYREAPVPKGDYRYLCYVAIGTVEDVRSAIVKLMANHSIW